MKLPILPDGFYGHDFIGAYKKEPNPRKRVRLLGLAYLQEGKNFIEAGKLLKVGRQTVSAWLTRFKEGGFENLKALQEFMLQHDSCKIRYKSAH